MSESYANAVIVACWLVTAISTVLLLYPMYESWRHQRKERRFLRMSGYMCGRLAVLDSWLKSGGRMNDLCKQVEREMLMSYIHGARENGPDYFKSFNQGFMDTQEELERLIRTLNINTEDDHEQEESASS